MTFGYKIIELEKRKRTEDDLSTEVDGALNHREDLYEEILSSNGEDIYLCLTSDVAIRVSQDPGIVGQVWMYTKEQAKANSAAEVLREAIKVKKLGLEAIPD